MVEAPNASIFFAKPVNGSVHSHCDMYSMAIARDPRIGWCINRYSVNIAWARNDIIYLMKKREEQAGKRFEYLYSIDSDIGPPDKALDMLLECDCDAAFLVCNVGDEGELLPTVFDKEAKPIYDWNKHDGPFDVSAAGTACYLVKRYVFDLLEPPWYQYVGWSSFAGPQNTEDIYFSRKCVDAGLSVKAYPVKPNHYNKAAI